MKLLQRGDVLVFEPPFKSFRDALLKLIDNIIEAVEDIPRLETKLYLDWMGPEQCLKVSNTPKRKLTFISFLNNLQPTIPEETVMEYKKRIRSMLEDQRIGPELRVQDFDEFLPLMNGKEEAFVQAFLSEERKFEEYMEQIARFQQLTKVIPFSTDYVVRMEMYEMHRTELIKGLELAAENFKDMLIEKCVKDYLLVCKRFDHY